MAKVATQAASSEAAAIPRYSNDNVFRLFSLACWANYLAYSSCARWATGLYADEYWDALMAAYVASSIRLSVNQAVSTEYYDIPNAVFERPRI